MTRWSRGVLHLQDVVVNAASPRFAHQESYGLQVMPSEIARPDAEVGETAE